MEDFMTMFGAYKLTFLVRNANYLVYEKFTGMKLFLRPIRNYNLQIKNV